MKYGYQPSKDGIGMNLTGFSDFEKLLAELPVRVEKKVTQQATMAAMREGRKIIRDAAPRNDGEQSPASKQYGTIRKNIRVIRLKRVPKNTRGARIDTGRAFWAYLGEIGTRHQSAKPWFAPAFRRSAAAIVQKLGESLGRGIEREAMKFKGTGKK